MTPEERDALVEKAAGAFRARDPRTGAVVPSAAWHDLDAEGLSTTARAVLARIRRAP
jgi:hypothetical protein